ncbi:MAG: hypothetical protein JOZ78_17565 [Chroococcidiopsidaceae cyanobacterium CP_BM_ER_R8_30]|nr:hypothetical protein [Chroococcidiopsidaceae cyanobacterium CP_BM_ER_R8_30]
MGLFFDVLSAINNPNQQASVSQLESITNTIQQVTANQGFDSSKTQSILSALGGAIAPALAQQQGLMGNNQIQDLVGRFGGGAGDTALQSLFPAQVQQQIIQGVAQKTGVSPNLLQSMLPTLLPAVLGLLNIGASKPGVAGGNPLLNAFLDQNRDGSADLGDVFKFATRFLSPARV